MANMDIFKLRDRVVTEYRNYVESFIHILDPEIDKFVQDQLDNGQLWPDAVLQLNPSFVRAEKLGDLADKGIIRLETAQFFGRDIQLYMHQREALATAQQRKSYIVTTGTGSGKSLTYLIPMYDAIMKASPEKHTVRAIIIYPMNALINSQCESLEQYKKNSPGSPVRFGKFTGQENEKERQAIIDDPPHILLTNYVMLEYIMLRPWERTLLETATHDLNFLVMDELHFYRGRQGADVAMLLRRLQQKAGHDLQIIGTSATMSTEGSREERQKRIAEVATRLFGVTVAPESVIGETLEPVTTISSPQTSDELKQAVLAPSPAPDVKAVTTHPLAGWIEEAFGIAFEEGRLVRHAPETFEKAVTRLANETGLDAAICREKLKAVLDAGNLACLNPVQPVFAFRLHQYLSSGSSVFATLEAPPSRILSIEGQYRADGERILFPLAFCRECGQEYYLVSKIKEGEVERLIPRATLGGFSDDDTPGDAGYFAVEEDDLWDDNDDDLPEHWLEFRKSGPRLKNDYAKHRPKLYGVRPDGTLTEAGKEGTISGWFQPEPLMLCLRCRAAYDFRDRDFRKLSSLSQTGRSTATTVVVNAAVSGMTVQGLRAQESKILSFTDNRQDASLQAGHLNDFVQVAQLRAGVTAAIRKNGFIKYDNLGPAIFDALSLKPEDFLQNPVDSGAGYEQGKKAMIDLLEYRALEDLSRGWRVAQPNLEQVGLLKIEYKGLKELAANDAIWKGLPAIGDATAERREEVIRALLDHLRMQLAMDAETLTDQNLRKLARDTKWLREPWLLDEQGPFRTQSIVLLPGIEPDEQEERYRARRLGARSVVGRYLRNRHTWDINDNLDADSVEELVKGIVHNLNGHILTIISRRRELEHGVRIIANSLRWIPGDGNPAPPDPVRTRALYLKKDVGNREANRYFTGLYGRGANELRRMVGHEHTGQVDADTRIAREGQFNKGDLPALFCSPTMELGVDIKDLYSVHLRNIPPTPANYAQRSGRAGRGGRPALIVAFAGQGNAHDQYFFRNREQMIAGAVEPARMDLRNQELVRAHIHSVWLSATGVSLKQSMKDIIDLDDDKYPLLPDVKTWIEGPIYDKRKPDIIEAAKAVVDRAPEIKTAWWYKDGWVEQTINETPAAFDSAFERWRELYRTALNSFDEAVKKLRSHKSSREEREEAEQRQREAQRQLDLLLNETRRIEESDFYPYRYLGAEGFLPGYNFPRLPVRALVNVKDSVQSIQRPRFLGLVEFAPGNIIYHEGQKNRVDSIMLPANGLQTRLKAVRLCHVCGYVHEDDAMSSDVCQNCGTRLDAANSDFPQHLLEQPAVKTRTSERISSDEEERLRNGYRVSTHFRFMTEPRRAIVSNAKGVALLNVTYAPAAGIWRINNGWRNSEEDGFRIDPQTGRWQPRARDDSDDTKNIDQAPLISDIKPFVRDSRNLLLIRPTGNNTDEDFLTTLLFALKRGIQYVYQLEEQEIAAELIGEENHRHLMFWEAAEGGTGIWERLIEEPGAFAEVAKRALSICHFDPGDENGEKFKKDSCVAACYECLLSYTNQPQHHLIDRRLIRDFLYQLVGSTRQLISNKRTPEEQYEWLKTRTDPNSPAELAFIDALFNGGYRLPDAAQVQPSADVATQPDFYYERGAMPGVCVFIDGEAHNEPAQLAHDQEVNEQMGNKGFRVIRIRTDKDFETQIQKDKDIFEKRNEI